MNNSANIFHFKNKNNIEINKATSAETTNLLKTLILKNKLKALHTFVPKILLHSIKVIMFLRFFKTSQEKIKNWKQKIKISEYNKNVIRLTANVIGQT